jgi:hypothetical protein
MRLEAPTLGLGRLNDCAKGLEDVPGRSQSRNVGCQGTGTCRLDPRSSSHHTSILCGNFSVLKCSIMLSNRQQRSYESLLCNAAEL